MTQVRARNQAAAGLAWTGDALGLMTEIMGKPEGVCGGIGGSQHLCAPGFMSNGIQGGIVPTAAGIARDHFGDYALTFYVAGALSIGAAFLSLRVKRSPALAGRAEDAAGDLTAERTGG